MKLMKNILIHILIVLIILMACFSVYYSSKHELPVYADSTTSEWTQVTTNEELAQAFEYYCKSRNLFIDGTVLGSATKFTTQSFDNICNTLGIDMSALQANIKKSTDKNGGLQYLFDTNGITAYNRIFAELLQNHNLQEGDSIQDYIVYSGELVEDGEGNTALVYIVPTTGNDTGNGTVTAYGSVYKYTSSQLVSMLGISTSYNEKYIPYKDSQGSKSIPVRCYIYNSSTIYLNTNQSKYNSLDGMIYFNSSRNANNKNLNMGYLTIGKVGNDYYAGIYNPVKITNISSNSETNHTKGNSWRYANRFYPVEADSAEVSFTTNNLTINSNTYTDNRQTVINNQGDVNNYDTDDEPPVNPPPSTVTPPSNSGGSDGDVTFPNFNFQLPEINWSLGDLHDKFPFSIPFDLVEFLTVLNAEPLTPEFEGDLNLGIINHHFEFDLHQFDGLAQLLRAMEFIGFCIGLIYITRQMLRV